MRTMTERLFDDYAVHSSAAPEGARFTALLVVAPRSGQGYPRYFAVCENRSFRTLEAAATAAAQAIDALDGLEDDGTPIFPVGYTGFDDDAPPA